MFYVESISWNLKVILISAMKYQRNLTKFWIPLQICFINDFLLLCFIFNFKLVDREL